MAHGARGGKGSVTTRGKARPSAARSSQPPAPAEPLPSAQGDRFAAAGEGNGVAGGTGARRGASAARVGPMDTVPWHWGRAAPGAGDAGALVPVPRQMGGTQRWHAARGAQGCAWHPQLGHGAGTGGAGWVGREAPDLCVLQVPGASQCSGCSRLQLLPKPPPISAVGARTGAPLDAPGWAGGCRGAKRLFALSSWDFLRRRPSRNLITVPHKGSVPVSVPVPTPGWDGHGCQLWEGVPDMGSRQG